MKTRRVFMLAVMLVLIVGTISASAAALSSLAAWQPWRAQVIDNNKPGVLNVSTAFVGNLQIPMLSWAETGSDIIYRAHSTPDRSGSCGPDNTWSCLSAGATGLVDGTLSNLATFKIVETHLLKWVYQTSHELHGLTIEQFEDMRYVTSSAGALVDLNKFGGILVGAPSLEIVGGHYRFAFTARDNGGDFPLYNLVYVHRTGVNNDSCIDSGSFYQCDVIEFIYGWNSIGPASLDIAGDGSIGIAYQFQNSVKFAYPWEGEPFFGRPANCGPGGNTWRCITVDGPSDGTIGHVAKLAFGTTDIHKAIVYNHKPTAADFVMRATYVGGGGNCGVDGMHPISHNPVYRWDCSDVDAFIDDIAQTTYSIAFDPQDFPVIAWNNQRNDEAQRLYVTYTNARYDPAYTTGWKRDFVDGNNWSFTGTLGDLSISEAGLGLIGYVQPSYRACGELHCPIDLSPNLKAALQWFTNSLPIIQK